MTNSVIPPSWSWTALGDVGAWLGGGTPSKSEARYWLAGKLPWVSPKDMKQSTISNAEDHITDAALWESSTQLIPARSVLIVTRSGILRHSLPVGVTTVPVAINQDLKAIVPFLNIDAGFLAFALRAFETQILHECAKSGTTVQSVDTQKLQAFKIPLAPTNEQRRIVASLEERLSELDSAVAGLQRTLVSTERYRDSIRAAAVRGRLFENEERFAELPAGWRWTTVGESADSQPNSITDGPFGSKLKTEHYARSGPRVIRLQNIGDGTFIDAEAHISSEHFATLAKHQVFAGDIVIAALGESLPRACIIPDSLGAAIVKADCIRFKPNAKLLLAKYANIALNAEPTRKRAAALVHGVGRPRLNSSEIRSITFPLPPLIEQRRIVGEVERRVSIANRTVAEIEMQLTRAARLRQSILRHAFGGKLVPQDANDEPVSILLERIRQDPAASSVSRQPGVPRRRATR